MTRPDAFPHTRRPLPWVLAGFLTLLFLAPVDQTQLKVHLPVNSKLDRFAVIGMLLAWIFFRGDQRTIWRSRRSKVYVVAAAIFISVIATGLFVNSSRALILNEWTLGEKQFAVLASLIIVSWFTLTALRTEDLRGFSTMMIGLGTILALGILIESRTGYNFFYSFVGALFHPIATVSPPGTDINPELTGVYRVVIVGPTSHPLAAVTMLAVVMPFALVRVFEAPSRRSWWLNAIAVALMTAGAVATQKKTGVLSLVAVFIFVGLHDPLKMLRLAPLAVVLVGFVHLVSPGSLGTVLNLGSWFNNSSSQHRGSDLQAIWPDVLAHPLLGRGFGTVDISRPDQFRIMDDQILGMLWQAGALGLISYVWMIFSPIFAAVRVRRFGDPGLRQFVLAASAACVAYFVVNSLFDTLSFVQGPYMFFIVAAMCTVATGAVYPQSVRQRVRVKYRSAPAPA